MKRTFISYLSLLLICLFATCSDDIPKTLKGTSWVYSVSGSEALEMFEYPDDGETSITYTVTIQFLSETEVKFIDRIKGTIDGESVNEIFEPETGTYTYDEENGIVTICFEVCLDATINKNKLIFTEDGETLVFEKK